jgi:adenylate kinase family enzyme
MNKVIVIGCPGSGKSTFSRDLRDKTGLPLFYLDMMYWNCDRTIVEKSIFRERLQNALHQEAWIIDGNHASTMEMRMQLCDTVFFLDYATDVCLDGIKSRQGKTREDMPWIENVGEIDEDFIHMIRNYRRESRPKVLALLEKYQDKNIIVFHNREESTEYLQKIKPTE